MDIVYQAPYLNGLLNILSILLGIAALAFAIHSLQVRGCLICCTLSGGCCSLALLLQHMDMDHLAQIGDTSAMLDTAHARVFAGTVLLVVCFGLNVLALLRSRKQKQPDCENGC